MLSDKIARAVREQNASLENFSVQAEAIAGFAGRVAESFQQGESSCCSAAAPSERSPT